MVGLVRSYRVATPTSWRSYAIKQKFNDMGVAVKYHYQGDQIQSYFANPNAKLPVRTKSGNPSLLPWGRRQQQAGNLPLGGWARLRSIENHRWDKYFPQPVKLATDSFMEHDFEGNRHWFELTRGQWIQGLVARYDQEIRVYIVTITPEREDALFERWPRLLVG